MSNTSKSTKETKSMVIPVRVTKSEYNQVQQFAKQNNQNNSMYMLNQALHPQLNFTYTLNFKETLFKLSDLINNLSTESPVSKNDIDYLRKEMNQLWLLLK